MSRCLFITSQTVFKKIVADEVPLYHIISKFYYETEWDRIISWAKSRGADEDLTRDKLYDAVADLTIKIETRRIFLFCSEDRPKSCHKKTCSGFVPYFWKMVKNMVFSEFRKQKGVAYPTDPKHMQIRYDQNITNEEDTLNEIDASVNNIRIDDSVINVYIYVEELNKKDKKHYYLYYVMRLSHDQVVARTDTDITTNAASRNTRKRLKKKIKERILKIRNDLGLMDYISLNYGKNKDQ